MLILVNRYPETFDGLSRTDHLGLLATPTRVSVAKIAASGYPWAADNGCYHAFDEPAYRRMLAIIRRRPAGCIFVTLPDVVGDAYATLCLFHRWLGHLIDADESKSLPVALVGQDGLEDLDADFAFGLCDAFFIGGTTKWKLSRAAVDLADEAKRRGLWLHMGRVNKNRRLKIAHDLDCDSADGSSYSWFPKANIPGATAWLRHLDRAPRLF